MDYQNMERRFAGQGDDSKWRSSDVQITENDVDFSSFQLHDNLRKGLNACGFYKPSNIQLKGIPMARTGLDLVLQAKSGTGKTCVFSVVALETIKLEQKSVQVLILCPTREIAHQISQVILSLGKYMNGLSCKLLIGGTKVKQDRESLRKCHIAVGTPGRIKYLIESNILKTNSLKLFIMDEADKLMDEKFRTQINDIFNLLPESKQMIAVSATYSDELAQFLTRYMQTPQLIRFDSEDPSLTGVSQYLLSLENYNNPSIAFDKKIFSLLQILKRISFNQCIIFSNNSSRAELLCKSLKKDGWPIAYISSEQNQKDRFISLRLLKNVECRILVSTDITARGIDAENVNLVINLDVPQEVETYLHRIGRAGRFGTEGVAITLACKGKELDCLKRMVKRNSLKMVEIRDISKVSFWNHNKVEEAERYDLDDYIAKKGQFIDHENDNPNGGRRKYKSLNEVKADYENFMSANKEYNTFNGTDHTENRLNLSVNTQKRCQKYGISFEEMESIKKIFIQRLYDSNDESNSCKNFEELLDPDSFFTDQLPSSSFNSVGSSDDSIKIILPSDMSYIHNNVNKQYNSNSHYNNNYSSNNQNYMETLEMGDELKELEPIEIENIIPHNNSETLLNAILPSNSMNKHAEMKWAQALFPPVESLSDPQVFKSFMDSNRGFWEYALDPEFIQSDCCACSQHHSGFKVTSHFLHDQISNQNKSE